MKATAKPSELRVRIQRLFVSQTQRKQPQKGVWVLLVVLIGSVMMLSFQQKHLPQTALSPTSSQQTHQVKPELTKVDTPIAKKFLVYINNHQHGMYEVPPHRRIQPGDIADFDPGEVESVTFIRADELSKAAYPQYPSQEQLGDAEGLMIIRTHQKPAKAPLFSPSPERTESIQLKSNDPQNGQPLIILDGKNLGRPDKDQSPLAEIKPEDIERIEVLKGEAAIEQFGEEGANGVIIITSKAAAKAKVGSVEIQSNGVVVKRDKEKEKEKMKVKPEKPGSIKEKMKEKPAVIETEPLQFRTESLTDLSLTVFPNPADEMVQIELELKQPSTVKVSVHTLSGQLIEHIAHQRMEGRQILKWNAAGQAAGVYLIQIEKDGQAISKRIVLE